MAACFTTIKKLFEPCYKGFYAYHGTLVEAQKHQGLHGFFNSPEISLELLTSRSSIQFCDHCEVMARIVARLNKKIDALENKNR